MNVHFESPKNVPGVRSVLRVVRAQRTSDGAGVRLSRSLGTATLPMLDPFLMLDEFSTDRPEDYLAGFPDHPHRGFETVTYMLAGAMEHKDHSGNTGRLGPGSVQWMTAGRGIIHSEMPKQKDGLMRGFQLWVNLPSSAKMMAPRYQDIAAERVPVVHIGGAEVKVLAGEAFDGDERVAVGPVEGIITAPLMLDVNLSPGGKFVHRVPRGHAAFAYVFEGSVDFAPEARRVNEQELAVLGAGERIVADSREGGRFLLLAAAPIREPVARYGPFVMNTEAELRQAFLDYEAGRLTASR